MTAVVATSRSIFRDYLSLSKPRIVMLLVFGGLIVLTQGSAVAPFIYTIF